MQNEHGEYFPYKDRRQEIVFIGHMMNKEAIESILNECLLTDEEMALGPEKWKEAMDEYDVFQLKLDDFIEMEQVKYLLDQPWGIIDSADWFFIFAEQSILTCNSTQSANVII